MRPDSQHDDPLAEIALLRKFLAREKAARKQAESIAEHKTRELYKSNIELRGTLEKMSVVEQQLVGSLDTALRATEAKSKFLANIGHEIRTPMNAILGFSSLALDSRLDERQRDYLSQIQQAGNNLLGIINDILDFTRIESGKLVVENARVDLQAMLDGVVLACASKADAKALYLTVEVSHDVPAHFRGDAVRLGQVLGKYVDNAIKFTVRGGVVVKVMRQQTNAGALLRFEVRDTGIGLDSQQIQGLYQSFSQVDDSSTRSFGGTGLGLAICKQLAALMGGQVGVESVPAVGSTFWLTLPLEADASVTAALVHADEWSGKLQALRGSRMLLLADDNMSKQACLDLLQSAGFVAETACNVQMAIEMLDGSADAFDLVLMDLQIPGLDGIAASKRMRQVPRHRPLPIVAFASNILPAVREQYAAAGIVDLVPRAFLPADMWRVLVRWIKPQQENDGMAASLELPDSAAMEKFQIVLARLLVLLRNSDAEAQRLWSQHTTSLRLLLGAQYGTVARAIDGFDFESARKIIQDLVARQDSSMSGAAND